MEIRILHIYYICSAIGWACKMNDYQLFSMILLHEKFLASGENEGIPIIKDVPISALLRESSILNINQKNNNGMTPLHLAIIKGSQTVYINIYIYIYIDDRRTTRQRSRSEQPR